MQMSEMTDLFLKVAKFKIENLVSAEDFSDKYNYQITCVVLILLVLLIAFRQFMFSPIQCWIPHEWSRSWEEYAENYCWVQDTYLADTKDGPPKSTDERKRLKINYYQWVPFVLAIQCLLFYIPHVVWKLCSKHTEDGNVNNLIRLASEAAHAAEDKRENMIRYLGKEIQKMMDSKRDDYPRSRPCPKICNQSGRCLPFYMFGKRSGFLLFVIYIGVKMLYLVNGIGQLFLMHRFIGADTPMFGINILMKFNSNQTWEHTGIFPRVTWCDLRRKVIANSQLNSFMCVLPANMLNEKIYIFLWFWIMVGLILTLTSIVTWIVRMAGLKNRKMFIKKYLRILGVINEDQKDMTLTKAFTKRFLRYDGIFILMMIERNAGDFMAADIVCQVYSLWIEKRKEEEKKMQGIDLDPRGGATSLARGGRKGSSAALV